MREPGDYEGFDFYEMHGEPDPPEPEACAWCLDETDPRDLREVDGDRVCPGCEAGAKATANAVEGVEVVIDLMRRPAKRVSLVRWNGSAS